MTMPNHLYAPPRSLLIHPGYIAGRTYPTLRVLPDTAVAVTAVDLLYFYSFMLPETLNFTAASMRVGTGGAASSVKAGIWANSPLSMRPLGAPLYRDNTGVATATSSTNIVPALGRGTLLRDVIYWFGSKYTGTLPMMYGLRGADTYSSWLVGSSGPQFSALSYADAYANGLPAIVEGAAFTNVGSTIPALWLTT